MGLSLSLLKKQKSGTIDELSRALAITGGRSAYLDSSRSGRGSWLLGGGGLGLLHVLGSADGLLTLSFAHFGLLVSLLHDVLESGASDGTLELGQLARLLLGLSLDLKATSERTALTLHLTWPCLVSSPVGLLDPSCACVCTKRSS